MINRKQVAVTKAFQSFLASQTDLESIKEYNISCATRNYGIREVWNRDRIDAEYPRLTEMECYERDIPCGASKMTYVLEHIVIKRMHKNYWNAHHNFELRNQCDSEVRCWNALCRTNEADYLCPILKSFTLKGGNDDYSEGYNPHYLSEGEKAIDYIIVIAQKAEKIGNMERMCKAAVRMNNEHGITNTETAEERYNALYTFGVDTMGWRDVHRNSGNCGVIYDYHQKKYKAVIVDYAL